MPDELSRTEGETVDEICGGRFRIIQRESGYRVSVDALLLAHFVLVNEGERLIELGTGCGVVALILASRGLCATVLGIEIQEDLVAIAKRNCAMNGLAGVVEIGSGDVRRPESMCAPQSFDVAVFNPPYRRLSSGRINPDPGKAIARHEIAGTVADFLAAAAYALKHGGRSYVIYPAKRMVELISRMRARRIEPKRIRLVHSRPGGVARFILAEGLKGGKEELTVLPPLFIYGRRGYSVEMAAIFRELSAVPGVAGGLFPSSSRAPGSPEVPDH
jgi:tRNA1Val (adenine37-N6)-methyltransferase